MVLLFGIGILYITKKLFKERDIMNNLVFYDNNTLKNELKIN